MARNLIAGLVTALVVAQSAAQSTGAPEHLTRREMLEDLDALEVRVQRSIGITRDLRAVSRRINDAINAERRDLPERATRHDLAGAMWRIVASLGDGHARVEGTGASDVGRPPVDVAHTADGLIVRAFTGAPVPGVSIGDRIVAVDGIEVDETLRGWSRFVPASTRDGLRHRMARNILSSWDTTVQVDLQGRDGQTRLATLEAVASPPAATFGIASQRLDDGGVLLRVPSFDGPNELPGLLYAQGDRAMAAALAPGPVRYVILDLRGNPGGSLNRVAGLAAPLLPQDCPSPLATEVIRDSPEARDYFVPLRRGTPDGTGWWLKPTGRRHPETPTRFAGPLAILVDGGTACAAELCAAMLRRHRPNTVLVGSVSAGSVAFAPQAFTLPHSRLRVRWSIGHIADMDGPLEGAGREPDIPVAWTRASILSGRDPYVDVATRALLRRLDGTTAAR